MKIGTLLAIAATATVAFASPAAAQRPACGDRTKIIERLTAKYGETRQSMGLNHNNGIVEVYASPETGTWTILMTMPTGTACLLAAGENWDAGPELATRSGAPV